MIPKLWSLTMAITITCPHCGEEFQLSCEPDEGTAEFVIDCEICCRPMTVAVRVTDGQVADVQVSAA
jgi:transcription elongation factor Elf1